MPSRIDLVGTHGAVPAEHRPTVAAADLVVGSRRHLDLLPEPPARTHELRDLGSALEAIAGEPGRVCVLASGDPGFFGVLRTVAARFGPACCHVWPAPSSVALAFAAVAVPWDDAVVASAHGRPLDAAVGEVRDRRKAAVLTSPDSPPEALGAALLGAGRDPHRTRVVVCSRLGLPDEQVEETDLAGLAAGRWDPLSVVLLLDGDPVAAAPSVAWGLPEASFDHRAGMVTKAEVRAVVLGKLDLPADGVLWDVGAGSGSVAVEAARLRPRLRVLAVERRPDDAERIRANAGRHGVAVDVVHGEAPGALAGLPDPDRAFVGGGGIDVLDAVLGRLRPGGTAVAAYAALDRAAAAADRLGQLVQVAISRGARLPDGGLRLEAANPVFVAWGPTWAS